MRESYNIFCITLILTILIVSIFSVYADDSNSSDSTGNNTTNNTKANITNNAVIQPMSISPSVSINTTSVDLGNLDANGIEHTYSGITTVHVTAYALLIGSGDLYVRSTGDFTNGADTSKTIPLNNFQYSCPTVSSGKKSFTTTSTSIYHYTILGFTYDQDFIMNYYLTIPSGTDAGKYNTTIIYTVT